MRPMKHKTRKTRLSTNTVLSILLLIVFVALLTLSVTLVRSKILQNARSLGMSLAHSYAAEEEGHLIHSGDFSSLGTISRGNDCRAEINTGNP